MQATPRPNPGTLLCRSAAIVLAAACLWLWSAHVRAAESPATAATAPAPLRSYMPKAKETLDQVILHTLPESPLKIELLRQAFIDLNPDAIKPGKVPVLRKNTALVVPNHDVLLRQYLGSAAPPADTAPPVARFKPSTIEERRRWVQFP